MYTHVCKTANHWVDSGVKFLKNVDWKDVLKNAAGIAGEFFYVNDIYRVITGTDPITGEKASRLEAADGWQRTSLAWEVQNSVNWLKLRLRLTIYLMLLKVQKLSLELTKRLMVPKSS
ncbi:TPA: pre-toxin TG domain-containing protein [Streptococcus suis]